MTVDNAWRDIKIEHLAALAKDPFETFCYEMVEYEAFERHTEPWIDPPTAPDVPDGGRDFLLTVRTPPHTNKQDYLRRHLVTPLTEDALGRTAYSVKSGKNWLDLALRDIKKTKGTPRSVEVLEEGGHFKLLINEVAKLDETYKRPGFESKLKPSEHLARVFAERIGCSPDELSARIEVLDSQVLVRFLRNRGPEGLADRWAGPMGLVTDLHGVEEWRESHAIEREEPDFEVDESRRVLLDQIRAVLSSEGSDPRRRILWLVGPPGVGKTRLVIELLREHKKLEQRARVAQSANELASAFRERILVRHPNAILIVDDCAPRDTQQLARDFTVSSRNVAGAHLILLTPITETEARSTAGVNVMALPLLDDQSVRRMAANAAGFREDSKEVDQIVKLSQGFPWFAALLASEASKVGQAPRNMEEAVDWALASSWESEPNRGADELRRQRESTLLAVAITPDIDWHKELDVTERDKLALAVGLRDWSELRHGADACYERGILRRRAGWKLKYVTPLVLEREIIRRLLGPDGKDPGGKDLKELLPERVPLDRFIEKLDRLDLPSHLLQSISEVMLKNLVELDPGWDVWRKNSPSTSELLFIARYHPIASARMLRARIESTPLDVLRAGVDLRRDLVWALESLAHRAESFEEAEAGLFRLSLAENEPALANSATEVWTSLFLAELNPTHRSLVNRLKLLEQRLSETDPNARLLALKGLRTAIDLVTFRVGGEDLDGPPLEPSQAEAYAGRSKAWTLLGRQFADPDPEVARASTEMSIDLLRTALRAGVGDQAAEVITGGIDAFNDTERAKLREALSAAEMFEGEKALHAPHLRQLRDLVTARTFLERMLDQITSWDVASGPELQGELDDALARDALVGDASVLGHLDLLLSDSAVRARPFTWALGEHDTEMKLLEPLLEKARSARGREILAVYLRGHSERGRMVPVEDVLRRMRAAQDWPGFVAIVTEAGANTQRLRSIVEALRAGHLDSESAVMMRRFGWLDDLEDEAFISFVTTLLEVRQPTWTAVAATALSGRTRLGHEATRQLRTIMLRTLDAIATEFVDDHAEHAWSRIAKHLLQSEEVEAVARGASQALARDRGNRHFAWSLLEKSADIAPTAAWHAVRCVLDGDDARAGRLLLAFRFHRNSMRWPSEPMVDWVGDNERRARMIISLIRPWTPELHPVLRELMRRFGAHSSVARALARRIHDTDGLVASFAEHDARQLAHVRRWAEDDDPEVHTFAEELASSLEDSHLRHLAEEDDEQRRWGT